MNTQGFAGAVVPSSVEPEVVPLPFVPEDVPPLLVVVSVGEAPEFVDPDESVLVVESLASESPSPEPDVVV